MLTDARARKFDLVVVKSISRFARNTETVLKATRELKARGIGVIFHLQNINTLESTGELFITIMSAFAQGESDNCRTRMQYAYRSKYEQGIATTSAKYTYGFQPGPDGNIAIVEKEAEVVRMIFDWAAQGVWIALVAADAITGSIEKTMHRTSNVAQMRLKVLFMFFPPFIECLAKCCFTFCTVWTGFCVA